MQLLFLNFLGQWYRARRLYLAVPFSWPALGFAPTLLGLRYLRCNFAEEIAAALTGNTPSSPGKQQELLPSPLSSTHAPAGKWGALGSALLGSVLTQLRAVLIPKHIRSSC